jgi:glycosyltransferase involved in cell wall biosynthesis
MHVISYIILAFLAIRLLVALTNLVTGRRLLSGQYSGNQFISILIPARNESENIGRLLDNIISQDYTNFEVMVYDDMSEDDTLDIVKAYSMKDSRIGYIEGKELPGGWLGKNYACHRLSLKARGSFFLFMDADVKIEKGLIGSSLHYFDREGLALLSVFPQQEMVTAGEKLTVPLMNWILVSMLPLMLVEYSSRRSLSAANGQFMLFDAGLYRKYRWHEKARSHKVEDIEIVKLIKREGHRVITLLSNGLIRCRMYSNLRESIEGFSKNVTAFFGNSALLTLLFTIVTSFGIFVLIFTSYLLAAVYLILSVLLRIVISIQSRQNVLTNILLIIPQQIAFIVVVIKALYNKSVKYGNWKGRQIRF